MRINPAERQTSSSAVKDGPPVTPGEIYDRRNELSGNLSLEQEKRFVRKINKMLTDGQIKQGSDDLTSYKLIEMWGLALEGNADVPENKNHPDGDWRKPNYTIPRNYTRSLDYSSKLLRAPHFLEELHQLGQQAVDEFFAERKRLEHNL